MRALGSKFAAVALALALCAAPGAAVPQTQSTTGQGQEEITVYARSQEKTKDRIFLVGDVEIRYKDLRLFADRVEIDPKTKDCVATGNVTDPAPRRVGQRREDLRQPRDQAGADGEGRRHGPAHDLLPRRFHRQEGGEPL